MSLPSVKKPILSNGYTQLNKVHITKKFQCEINKDLKQTCMTLSHQKKFIKIIVTLLVINDEKFITCISKKKKTMNKCSIMFLLNESNMALLNMDRCVNLNVPNMGYNKLLKLHRNGQISYITFKSFNRKIKDGNQKQNLVLALYADDLFITCGP